MDTEGTVASTLVDLKRVAEVADAVGLADTRADALRALLAFRAEVRQQCEAECARDAHIWKAVRPLFQWNEIGEEGGRWHASLYLSERLTIEDAIEKLQQL